MCSPRITEQVRSGLSRRQALGMVGAAVAAGVASRLPVAARQATPAATGPRALTVSLGSYTQVQDLTHTITPDFPVFPGDPQLLIEPL